MGNSRRDELQPHALRERLRDRMLTGLAVTIPLIVTLIVLQIVVNFLSNTLEPVVTVFGSVLGWGVPDIAIKGVTFLLLLLGIFVVGAVTQRGPAEPTAQNSFDRVMERIPGLGSIYTSFNEMSQLLLESDTDSFRDVKLVEFPGEGSYTLAFLTAETPDLVTEATGDAEMETLFLPMAPNPVMGGHVISVDKGRIYDIELTVEEAIQIIVTSGVAIEELGDDRIQAADSLESAVDDESAI